MISSLFFYSQEVKISAQKRKKKRKEKDNVISRTLCSHTKITSGMFYGDFSGWLAIRAWIICYEMLSYYCQHTFQALTKCCSEHYSRKDKVVSICSSRSRRTEEEQLVSQCFTPGKKKQRGRNKIRLQCSTLFPSRAQRRAAHWSGRTEQRAQAVVAILPNHCPGTNQASSSREHAFLQTLEESFITQERRGEDPAYCWEVLSQN